MTSSLARTRWWRLVWQHCIVSATQTCGTKPKKSALRTERMDVSRQAAGVYQSLWFCLTETAREELSRFHTPTICESHKLHWLMDLATTAEQLSNLVDLIPSWLNIMAEGWRLRWQTCSFMSILYCAHAFYLRWYSENEGSSEKNGTRCKAAAVMIVSSFSWVLWLES